LKREPEISPEEKLHKKIKASIQTAGLDNVNATTDEHRSPDE
jgi:hypothetical protein